uniref:Growth arrest and DNA-damage-inducible, beta b n=1 Tax=Xiphophorus couchianus TaxID=32473 RepID=A0A3B5MGX9_9TELE
ILLSQTTGLLTLSPSWDCFLICKHDSRGKFLVFVSFCVQMSNCSVPILRMQSASLALEELLVTAQKQHCLTVGIYESAKLLNADPDSVVLCVLAADDEEDVALQIHFTLLQSFCCDSGINILRVSGVQRLWQLLGGVDANRNQEESGDLHCMLVTVGLLRQETAWLRVSRLRVRPQQHVWRRWVTN